MKKLLILLAMAFSMSCLNASAGVFNSRAIKSEITQSQKIKAQPAVQEVNKINADYTYRVNHSGSDVPAFAVKMTDYHVRFHVVAIKPVLNIGQSICIDRCSIPLRAPPKSNSQNRIITCR